MGPQMVSHGGGKSSWKNYKGYIFEIANSDRHGGKCKKMRILGDASVTECNR